MKVGIAAHVYMVCNNVCKSLRGLCGTGKPHICDPKMVIKDKFQSILLDSIYSYCAVLTDKTLIPIQMHTTSPLLKKLFCLTVYFL